MRDGGRRWRWRLAVAGGDGGQCCAQVGVRVCCVQFAGFNERGHERGHDAGPGVAARIMACEEGILAIASYRQGCVFGRVVLSTGLCFRQGCCPSRRGHRSGRFAGRPGAGGYG